MNLFRNFVISVSLFLGVSSAAHAQSGFGVEANVANDNEVWGGEFGVGYTIEAGPVRIRPGAGVFIFHDEDSRYQSETFSNGQTVCRDTTNGQFADDIHCAAALRPYGRLEATVVLGEAVELGGGGRVTEDGVTPYGTVGVVVSRAATIRGYAGESYFAGGIALRF